MKRLNGIAMSTREALENMCMEIYKYNEDGNLLLYIDGLCNAKTGHPSLFKYPYEIFTFIMSHKQFIEKYESEDFKLYIPELEADDRLFSFNADHDEQIKAPYINFTVNTSSVPLTDRLGTYVIDLNEPYWNVIKSVYFVSIGDIYRLIATGSVFSNDLSVVAKKAIDSVESESYIFKNYTLVPVPFNRSQPVIKGEQYSAEFLLKNNNDIDDIEVSVQRIYRRSSDLFD